MQLAVSFPGGSAIAHPFEEMTPVRQTPYRWDVCLSMMKHHYFRHSIRVVPAPSTMPFRSRNPHFFDPERCLRW